jgi:4-carboxymuconolactone decarboxylase
VIKRHLFLLALAMTLSHAVFGAWNSTSSGSSSNEKSSQQPDRMKIKLTIKGRVLTATLHDNKTAQDFVSLLPLTLTMNDLFGREKYGQLPRSISEAAKRAHSYEVGQIVYWSPGPDVAIFYRNDRQAIPDPGIIVIGQLDSGVEALNVDGSVKVKIEAAGQPSSESDKVTAVSNALPATVPPLEDLRTVAPAFAKYTEGPVLNGLWKRPGLSPRDRSIITVSVLIARNQTIEMPYHFNLALDNGVNPSELSEIITHLAFYSGWANATSAVAVAKEIFAKRGIVSDQAAAGDLLPLDEAAEAQRAARVEQDAGPVAPGVVQYTSDLLFHDLWLRPALASRDRSLVTVSALVANGQIAQVTYHLNRAMDNGLTKSRLPRC